MEADGVADAGLSDCLGHLEGVELVLCRIVTGGIDVLAEAENAVDVTQDEPALEDELARKSKREVRSEREESEVSRCETPGHRGFGRAGRTVGTRYPRVAVVPPARSWLTSLWLCAGIHDDPPREVDLSFGVSSAPQEHGRSALSY